MKKNLLILVTAICSINCFAQIPPWLPSNGLVAWYPFTGNAKDSSGNSNNGTVTGATLVNDRFGNPSKAYHFSGSANSCISGSCTNFSTSARSVSLWYNGATIGIGAPSCRSVFGYGGGVCGTSWIQTLCTGSYIVGPHCANNWSSFNTTPLQNNSWHHWIITNDGVSQTKFYIDGALAFTTTNHYNNTNVAGKIFVIGNVPDYTGSVSCVGDANISPFVGDVDDVAIYNRVLTTTEVQQIYIACTAAPSASISSHGNTTFCTGDNFYLVASPATGVTYQWQKNSVNISNAKSKAYTATTSGVYRCNVTNPCGTSTTNTITVTTLPLATVTIATTGSTTFCAGDSVTFAGNNPGAGYSYQWYKGSVSIKGATGLSYKAYSPGSYKMVNTNTANGCSRISNAKSVVVNCRIANPNLLTGSGFNSDDADNPIHLYPNPSTSSFSLELNDVENGTAKIELVNSLGQTVYRDEVEILNGQFQKLMELNNINQGLHILRVLVNDKRYESKVIIN